MREGQRNPEINSPGSERLFKYMKEKGAVAAAMLAIGGAKEAAVALMGAVAINKMTSKEQ